MMAVLSDDTWRYHSSGALAVDGGVVVGFPAALPTGMSTGVGLGIDRHGGRRYGFPDLLLSLAINQVSLSYWDYQLRLDGGNARNGWTVFAFGRSRRR